MKKFFKDNLGKYIKSNSEFIIFSAAKKPEFFQFYDEDKKLSMNIPMNNDLQKYEKELLNYFHSEKIEFEKSKDTDFPNYYIHFEKDLDKASTVTEYIWLNIYKLPPTQKVIIDGLQKENESISLKRMFSMKTLMSKELMGLMISLIASLILIAIVGLMKLGIIGK